MPFSIHLPWKPIFGVLIGCWGVYIGLYSRETCEEMNGYAECSSGFGAWEYKGEWQNGYKEGKGVESGPGFHYEGDFKNNLRDGLGCLELSGYMGLHWKYTGEFVKGKRHGKGIQQQTQWQETYDGEWMYDAKTGHGKLVMLEMMYEGQIERGLPHGQGELRWEGELAVLKGSFVRGMPCGEGIMEIGNNLFEGVLQCKAGVPEGHGSLTTSFGDVLEGIWEYGWPSSKNTPAILTLAHERGIYEASWTGNALTSLCTNGTFTLPSDAELSVYSHPNPDVEDAASLQGQNVTIRSSTDPQWLIHGDQVHAEEMDWLRNGITSVLQGARMMRSVRWKQLYQHN